MGGDMADQGDRSEIEQLAAELHERVLRAREAEYKADAIRREIVYLMAKVEALQKRNDTGRRQPPSDSDSPIGAGCKRIIRRSG